MKKTKEHLTMLEEMGNLARNWRIGEGMTRKELFRLSGVHMNTIKRLEDGENITILNLKKIADGLGVDLSDLLPEE